MYTYTAQLGERVLVAKSVRDVCAHLNKLLGANIVSPNMIYNIIHRPPRRRIAVPGLKVSRQISLCKTSAS